MMIVPITIFFSMFASLVGMYATLIVLGFLVKLIGWPFRAILRTIWNLHT